MRPLFAGMLLTASLLMGAASAPVSLVQNEYDFAAAVAKHGVRDGFLRYLDRQAIGFSPTPAKAYDAYRKAKPSSAKLLWYPSYALLASSGDFGVDTGPWIYEAVGKDGNKVQAFGDWLTVWHRDQDGRWKALFDGGIGHDSDSADAEKPLAHDIRVDQMRPAMGPVLSADQVRDQLMQSERAFAKVAATDSLRQAFQDSGSAELRLLLDKNPPVPGRDLAEQAVPAVASDMMWDPMGSGAARSGDLGYVYGETYRIADTQHGKPIGVYMHVWRREAGSWKLLIALEQPL